jgi:hypothetical protein
MEANSAVSVTTSAKEDESSTGRVWAVDVTVVRPVLVWAVDVTVVRPVLVWAVDVTVVRPVLAWRELWNLRTVYLLNFPIFFGPQ